MVAAGAALIIANSPLSHVYFGLLHRSIGGLELIQWINEALMALFFLLVGLEIKRELQSGQLSSWPSRTLPCIAAAGGVIIPALIYIAVNSGTGGAPRGWAIPSATDIAFALGVLALFGQRIPQSLKLLLTALAIIDDLVAITIIAVFYTEHLALASLALAGVTFLALMGLNRFGVTRISPYLALGAVLWFFVLKSGVHPTLAGVALAFALPVAVAPSPLHRPAPLHGLEHRLQPWVAFGVVPLFGFANAGVSFAGVSPSILLRPALIGVAAGLFFGKQLGVIGFSWTAIRLGVADFPVGATWRDFYGVALLCGIGFTMSLFIGVLAFAQAGLQDQARIGVLAGSLLSGLGASAVLAWPRRPRHQRSVRPR